jgi:multidrug efflux pump subunit AcrA (membrane-fusion protein)
MSKKIVSIWMMSVFLALLSACSPGASRKPTPTPLPPLVSYEKALFTVERGSIVSQKNLLGDIVPSKQDELFFRAPGYINRVVVKPGDKVKKGDMLAEMQIDDLLNQLQQARIDLEVAEANHAKDQAQREYDLNKAKADVAIWQKKVELAKIDLQQAYGIEKEKAQLNLGITQENLKLAEEAFNVLSSDTNTYTEQAVKRSKLAVDRLEALVAERQIVAPYDCTVLRSTIRAGQQADAFNTAFVVGDPTDLVVRSPYDSDLEGKLQEKSEVSMKFSKDAKETYPAQFMPNFAITSTGDQSAKANSTISTGDYFYFSLPKDIPQDQLRIGRQVYLSVILGKKDNVLLLPKTAIREYKGLNFVIVQEGDRRRRVEINEIGLKSDDLWEIFGDLKEGDQVLGP